MLVYLAASFSRQQEMRDVATALETYGVKIVSRWLNENQSIHTSTKDKFLRECAFTDVNDVKLADVIVRFADDLSTESIPSHLGTGARHFEMGLAFALGKPLIVVGKRQNIFDFLPHVTVLKDMSALIRHLSLEEIN